MGETLTILTAFAAQLARIDRDAVSNPDAALNEADQKVLITLLDQLDSIKVSLVLFYDPSLKSRIVQSAAFKKFFDFVCNDTSNNVPLCWTQFICGLYL